MEAKHNLAFSIVLTLLTLVCASPALAWSEHHLITHAILAGVPELQGRELEVTSFESCVKALGFQSVEDFNVRLKLNRNYRFELRAGEQPGMRTDALETLSVYSDEPDWGMDKELFGPEQYPELWKPEYSKMGGKTGTPSQAFRHMYWQGFDLLHPLATFKLPKVISPMGEAPTRAALFVSLAQRARSAGHPYWAARFTANALHYLEDVSQPFHSTQTPTKRFMVMPFTEKQGSGGKNYIGQIQNLVAYYHFAFEDYVGKAMTVGHPASTDAARGALEGALGNYAPDSGDSSDWTQENNVAVLVRAMARESSHLAGAASRASIAFFPPIEEPFSTLDPESVVARPEWWKKTIAHAQSESPEKRQYFSIVGHAFGKLGQAVRALVHREL